MTIDQQLDTAEGEITELQLALADAWDDPAKRRRLADKLQAARNRVTALYDLQAAHAA
ncbi:hypothetical protein ACFC26_16085 [Kitasatospora purpeofusca]|uniref:hypothetical protein n=1 Tax=Kitasatospora purpeofusca TaxID=67352 RepID=UPI0035D554F5